MPQFIDRHETRRLVEEGGQLVEVLPRRAYEHMHLPGAVSAPLKQFRDGVLDGLDRQRPVIVYCSGYL